MVFHVKPKCKTNPMFSTHDSSIGSRSTQSSKKYYDLWSLNKDTDSERVHVTSPDLAQNIPSCVHYLFGWNKKIAYFLNFEVGEQYRH